MLTLNEKERIELVIHKHWFVLARNLSIFFVLILIPPFILSILPFIDAYIDTGSAEPFISFLLILYSMAIFAFLFYVWLDHYLDMWIVTNERVVDVEQYGLFSREISEIPLHRIQDITIEVRGVLATLLRFGTIRIQTAGEREFFIHFVPHLYEAKDVILKVLRRDENKSPHLPAEY